MLRPVGLISSRWCSGGMVSRGVDGADEFGVRNAGHVDAGDPGLGHAAVVVVGWNLCQPAARASILDQRPALRGRASSARRADDLLRARVLRHLGQRRRVGGPRAVSGHGRERPAGGPVHGCGGRGRLQHACGRSGRSGADRQRRISVHRHRGDGSARQFDLSRRRPDPLQTAGQSSPALATFNDVPTTDPAFQYIEALFASGATGGCGGGAYCPNAPVTRRQMAVFLAKLLGLHWPSVSAL